jgi:hypothetical protein
MDKSLIAAVQQRFHYFLGGDGSTSNNIFNTVSEINITRTEILSKIFI